MPGGAGVTADCSRGGAGVSARVEHLARPVCRGYALLMMEHRFLGKEGPGVSVIGFGRRTTIKPPHQRQL